MAPFIVSQKWGKNLGACEMWENISRNQEKDQINSSSYKTQLLTNLLVFVKWC